MLGPKKEKILSILSMCLNIFLLINFIKHYQYFKLF